MDNFDRGFRDALDELVPEPEIITHRPRGAPHPGYPHITCPLDYGYLRGTASMDGGGIDLWAGTGGKSLGAPVCTVEPLKRGAELKLPRGRTEAGKAALLQFHRQVLGMGALLIQR